MNLVEIDIRTNDQTDFAGILAKAEALKKALNGNSLLGFNPQAVDSELSALKSKLQSHGIADLLDINMNQGQIEQQLMLLKRKVANSGISDLLDVNLNEAQVSQQLAGLGKSGVLQEALKFTPDFTNGIDLSNLPVKGENVPITVTDTGVQAAGGALGGLDAGLRKVADDSVKAAAATGLFNDSISKGLPLWSSSTDRAGLFATAMGLVRGHLQLFGGALTDIGLPAVIAAASGMHMLAEYVIETSATLIPAAIAFTAFGAAATPTVLDLYKQMTSLYTATQALGTQLPGMTGGFQSMVAAAKPQVYELFGEAMYTASHSTGAFATMAQGAGKVLDDLGARMAYAVTQGKGVNTFAQTATSDLAGWGDSIGNITGIFGNLLKVMPGYAEMILSVADSVGHLAEVITGSAIGQGILSIGLAAHGAIFYIGLMGTAFAKLASSGIPALGGLLTSAASKLAEFGAVGESAASGVGKLGSTLISTADLPWGWISIAAAGFGFLAYQIVTAKDDAQLFNQAMQDAVQKSSLLDLGATISSAMAQTAAQLADANQQVAGSQAAVQRNSLATGRDIGNLNDSLIGAKNTASQYSAGLKALQGEQTLVSGRVRDLGAAYGGTAGALAALTGAGITSAQITSQSSQTWGEALIEVQAYEAALKETTLQDGRLGAAQNALNYVAGDTANQLGHLDSTLQGVTSAQSQMLGVLTGGSTALDTFQQGISTLASNFQQATGTGGTVNETLGKLKSSASLAGAAIGGTSAASYALNQAYYSQVQSAQGVIGALEMQNATTSQVTTATATMAGQMLGFAGNNTAARASLVDLINNGLGKGTVSLQSLDSWIGKNSTTLTGLNSIIAQAQIKASAFAGVLKDDVTSALAATVFQASGAKGAMTLFANAVQDSGDNSTRTKTARQQLITDLENAGVSAQGAKTLVNQLQTSIDQMHGKNVGVGVNLPTGKVQTFQQMIDSLHGKTVTIGTQVIGSSIIAQGMVNGMAMGGIVGHVPHAAAGGVRNGMTMVGELGPELVSLPQNSRVWPRGVTPPGMQGSGAGGTDGAAAPQHLIVEFRTTDSKIATALMGQIRVMGGDPRIFTRKVVLA